MENRTLLTAVVWDGDAGTLNWNDPLNWDVDRLPETTDDVFISNLGSDITINSTGTISIKSLTSTTSLSISGGLFAVADVSSIAGDLAFSSGTLAGTGNLTVEGLLTWSGGGMYGPGSLFAHGAGQSHLMCGVFSAETQLATGNHLRTQLVCTQEPPETWWF